MTVYIGEAASASIGLRKTKWRNFGQTTVIRAKDPKVAEEIAVKMEQAIANKKIGYAPKKTYAIRTSFYKEAKAKNWNIPAITEKCYTCCSQCVAVCINAVGISTPHDVNAKNLIANLKKNKNFEVFTDSEHTKKSDYLKRGDIIAAAGVHAAMVLSDGSKAAKSTKLAIDGIWGKITSQYVKKWVKVTVDSTIASQPLSNKKWLPAADEQSWKFVKRGYKGSDTIKALQKIIGTKADGYFGYNSVKALQKYLELAETGTMGSDTVKALQRFLSEKFDGDGTSEKAEAKTRTVKCIDVSYHQGAIDWKKIKASGIEHCILRCGYRSTGSAGTLKPDVKFTQYIKDAKAAGMKIGIYIFSQAKTQAEAKAEAEYCLKLIEPYRADISLPVAFDWEFNNRLTAKYAKSIGKTACGKICDAFCNVIKAAGYDTMVYANTSTLTNYLPKLDWKIWVAQYSSKCTYTGEKYMWQYSSKQKVSGIAGNVDMSWLYLKE